MTVSKLACLLASVSMATLCGPAFADSVAAQSAVASAPTGENGADDPFQIGVRADRRSLDPILAVEQLPADSSGEVRFAGYSNYAAFIARAEIRLFKAGEDPDTAVPLAVVPLDGGLRGSLRLQDGIPANLVFVLRVYGKGDAWDQTSPHRLAKLEPGSASEFGITSFRDETAHRAIEKAGVVLTVQGRVTAASQRVLVGGIEVPLKNDNRFLSEQIVPTETGRARIEIRNGAETQLIAERNYDARKQGWFFVAQGDITFSHAVANGPAVAVSGDVLAQGDHLTSRGAFYAKGVLGRDYRVTASLDTGETLVKDLFSNLDRKDPSQLLRRLDGRSHYPTFGDGSTITEDAPTQGRFYLRVQKDDSNLVVGNFITAAKGTELVQIDRGLFGVMLDYKTKGLTRFGERKGQVLAYASDPGTLTGADELRGTGGSLFYLRHQDLSVGSERVRLEIRSPQTGAVLSSTALHLDEDYQIDYYQGRVTLLRPLSSYQANDELVRAGAASGNIPVLVVRYEYSPPQGVISGHSLGGRASQWIGDWLRLGVTGQSELAAPADQLVLGTDLMLRASEKTWLKAEFGRTDGPGFAQSSSLDGGLNFVEVQSLARTGQIANAFRVEGSLDHQDLNPHWRGKATGYFEDYEAGYAAMGRITPNAMRRWGATFDEELSQTAKLAVNYEGRTDQGIGSTDLVRADWTQSLTPTFHLRTGLRYEDTRRVAVSSLASGARLDGGIEGTYAPIGANWSAKLFGQATLSRDETRRSNDRAGLGMKWQFNKELSAEGEVSNGTGGWAADLLLHRRSRNGSESHIGYRLYSDLTDRGYDPQELMTQGSRGVLVVGSQQRLSNTLTLVGEEKYGHGGNAPSLVHSYGLRFAPDKVWSFAASVEDSTIFANALRDTPGIDRLAATFSAGYLNKFLSVASSVEYRHDKQAAASTTSWLFRNKVDVVPDDSWRLLGRFEHAFSDVSGASLSAADFTRAVFGLAYRPVSHDRLNILGRFTYFRDMGPLGQIMNNSGIEQPKQVSRVASIDVSYDLANWLTLGAKYARREGRVSITRDSDTFVNSAAQLYALRADVQLARDWDLLVEGRRLTTSLNRDNRDGILIAGYRRFGQIKLGVGYNFTDYSADLTDQSYTTKGIFVNLLAAF